MDILTLPDMGKWRDQYKISQSDLAQLAGISLRTLSKIELDITKPIQKTIAKLRFAMDKLKPTPGDVRRQN